MVIGALVAVAVVFGEVAVGWRCVRVRRGVRG
jgi:hypothetical protein